MIGNSIQKTNELETETSPVNPPVTTNMKASENLKHANHDDVFEVWLYDYSGMIIATDKNPVFYCY